MKCYVDNHNCKFDLLSWHKYNALPTYSNKYLSDTEYCFHFYQGTNKNHPTNYDEARTYFMKPINVVDCELYGHPTIKPLEIIETLVRNSSSVNETVLDPFMCSGTTGVACKNLNRNFIGIELELKYFEIAKDRTEDKGLF